MYAAASARLAIAKNSVAEKSRQLQTASSRGTRRTFISSRSASLYARFNLYPLRTLLGDGHIIALRIRANFRSEASPLEIDPQSLFSRGCDSKDANVSQMSANKRSGRDAPYKALAERAGTV